MGFFDRWFGGKRLDTPEALREALFAAAAAADTDELASLCRKHRAAILASFAQWQKVPVEVRKDPARVQAYAQGLIGVATHLAGAGHPEPLRRLTSPTGDNPITRYQKVLEHAREHMAQLRYPEALTQLESLLVELARVQGSAVDRYLPIARGYVSECHFHSGNVEAAVAPALAALADCERVGDTEGIIAYQGNLYEIHRYLGEVEPASRYAELLASSLEAAGDAQTSRWYASQARVVRAGEPLNRVVVMVNENRYELDDLPRNITASVQFVFQRNRITLQPANAGIEEGMRLGGSGKYADALDALETAAKRDRFAPAPRYLAGLTLLHLKRYEAAVESYARCEELAPGWYHVRADRWFAEQLAAGKLEHGVLLVHLELTDGSASPERKLELASQVLGRVPDLGPFHLHRGKALIELGREAEAIQAFRDGLSHGCDPGTRTRLLAELGNRLSHPERRQHLEAAVALQGDLVSAAMARLMLAQAREAS